MLWGGSNGGLEVRTSAGGATVLRGRFPYAVPTVLQGGRERRREVFASRAFGSAIAGDGDVHFLVHHDFDRPLASRGAGTLTLEDDDAALSFEARLSPDLEGVSYVRDFLGTLAAGLVGDISPGFRVAEGGDSVTRDSEGLLRVVRTAILVEISAVTKPAYPQAQIEARDWTARGTAGPAGWAARKRWRA